MLQSFLLYLQKLGYHHNYNQTHSLHNSLLASGLNIEKIWSHFESFIFEKYGIKNINKLDFEPTKNIVIDDFSFQKFRKWISSGGKKIKNNKIGEFFLVENIDFVINNYGVNSKFFWCDRKKFDSILNAIYSNEITKSSIFSRKRDKNLYSKGKYLFYDFFVIFASILLLAIFLPSLFVCWYFFHIFFRLSILAYSIKLSSNQKFKTVTTNLPIYTILVPVYKETNILNQTVENLKNINYNSDFLDIKIVLEKDDFTTKNYLYSLSIPSHFSIIEVPPSLPRTKPKALNYAFHFCRGKYLVIYDAEDISDPNQLIAASYQMETDDSLAAVQCILNYYNKDHNIITAMCNTEYVLWFDNILMASEKIKTFIPLGGTSNHCRVDVVEEIGMWDAFNVTEDIEMSAAILKKGKRVGFVPIKTLEESVISIEAWIKQRTRWIKGYIVTMIHYFSMFNSRSFGTINTLGFNNFCTFIMMNYFIIPIIILTIVSNMSDVLNAYFSVKSIMASLIFYLFIGIFIVFFINKKARIKYSSLTITLIFPVYCCANVISCFRAIWQIYKGKDYEWEKTTHGYDLINSNYNGFQD